MPTCYTMALAGIWHGAGWQYLIYGVLHAAYLTVNHAWRAWRAGAPAAATPASGFAKRVRHAGNVLLTFAAALVAFAFFRAHGVGDALALLQGMAGLRGIEAPDWPAWGAAGMNLADWLHLVAGRSTLALLIVLLLAIVWCAPNSHQLMGRFSPALERAADDARALTWRPSMRWTLAMLGVLVFCVAQLHGEVRFLYFQF
ncbi:hypothetical protein [Paraburkholderia bengalensis]|uniref:hypothetical protein n=1 Tax=Paraburkholderia bengalensis TaxID=2747562 RepID=UPI0030151D69